MLFDPLRWQSPHATPVSSLSRWTPGQQALALWLLHLLLWTALPLLVSRNLPLDVVEALAWGREWQWGYYKHPPLSGWLAELARVGHHDWPLYLLAQAMVGGALAASWLLARDLLGQGRHSERLALVAMLALEGVHYHNLSSAEFNANVVMYPFWAWASLCFWRAMQPVLRPMPSGQAQAAPRATAWWLGLGLSVGLGLLGKYVFALLPTALLLYTLAEPQARRVWATRGPWLALALAAALTAPHWLWAAQHQWPTLHYALDRGQSDSLGLPGEASWSREFLSFVVAQALALAPMFGLLRLLGPGQATQRPRAENRLLLALGAGPLLLLMLAATVAQARMVHMWASPFFVCAAPLWLAWRRPARPQWRRFAWGLALWSLLLLATYAAAYGLGPQRKHHLDRLSYPGRDVAHTLASRWQAETGRPLAIVAGEEFVAGTVAQYAPSTSAGRPSVFYDADFSESLWLDPDQVSRQGALFVWPLSRGELNPSELPADSREQVTALQQRYPTLQTRPTLLVHTHWMGHPYTVAVAWAVLPPQAPSH